MHLLQSVRLCQALMEASLRLNISEQEAETYEYLRQFYDVNYEVNANNTVLLDVDISHSEPFVRLGQHKQPLIFPEKMFKLCKSYWQEEREIDYLFIGLIGPERQKSLEKWIKKNKVADKKQNIVIKNSNTGREFPEKAWDSNYYEMLANAKFVLCPNGDFIWTYRFFEAALCGAIPVIEDYCELYEGFIYYSMHSGQQPLWSVESANANYVKARDLLGVPDNLSDLLFD